MGLHQLPGHRHPRLLAQVQLGRGRAQASIVLLSRSELNSNCIRGYICLVIFREGIYIRPTREWQGCGPVPQGSETRRGCICLDTAALSPPVGLRLVDVAVILVVEPVCNIQHDLRYRGYCSIFTRGEGSRRLHNHGEGPYGLLMLSHLTPSCR